MPIAGSDECTSLTDCTLKMNYPQNSNYTFQCKIQESQGVRRKCSKTPLVDEFYISSENRTVNAVSWCLSLANSLKMKSNSMNILVVSLHSSTAIVLFQCLHLVVHVFSLNFNILWASVMLYIRHIKVHVLKFHLLLQHTDCKWAMYLGLRFNLLGFVQNTE
jgi:hypothetical protein